MSEIQTATQSHKSPPASRQRADSLCLRKQLARARDIPRQAIGEIENAKVMPHRSTWELAALDASTFGASSEAASLIAHCLR
jgi:DNA-binding XRE family transcriptional regulator